MNVKCIHHFKSLGLVLWHIQNYLHFTDEKIEAQLDWFCLSLNGLPWRLCSKASTWNSGDEGSIPKLGGYPWRRKWQPTPVFLPGRAHGLRSLAGYSPWGQKKVGYRWVTECAQWGKTFAQKDSHAHIDSEAYFFPFFIMFYIIQYCLVLKNLVYELFSRG